MKHFLPIILFAAISLSVFSQNKSLNYNNEGYFKIVQFTDIHYQQGKKESAIAIELINEVLDAEKPDFVVFTGDVVWAKPVKKALDEVFAPVIDRSIPWAYVFGNHDDEFGMSRAKIMDYVVQKPYCMASAGDKKVHGVGNYILEVRDRKDKNLKTLLYFLDSGRRPRWKGLGGYDWFDFTQVEWYREMSKYYSAVNKNKPYPALAFFHIPLIEYAMMSADENSFIGSRKETECTGALNPGMFAAMREMGDIMGTFCGHDHDNDYIGGYNGIYLAYGRYSGGNTVYNNLGKNGCRIIELKEGKREFTTYIRLLGGDKLYDVKYPKTFKLNN